MEAPPRDIADRLSRLEWRIESLERTHVTKERFEGVEKSFVTKDQFYPVRILVLGGTGAILLALVGAIFRIVITYGGAQ